MLIIALVVLSLIALVGFMLLDAASKTSQNLDEENYPDVEHEKAK